MKKSPSYKEIWNMLLIEDPMGVEYIGEDICPVCGSNQVQFKRDYPDEPLIGDFDYYCGTCEQEGRPCRGARS